jgi:ATP-dependent DNA helicase RecG
MFIEQRKRFFPLPDYVFEPEQQRVEVRITGRILGEQYTHALMRQPDFSLMDVFLLDKVQKRNRVKNLLADLSRRNLIAPERKGPGARWRLVPQK